ncbi:GNAT family N-acetyltransferase [Facklamia sp. 7083-14-GEN3]|uniref:GNAT family N-acetyltransferase n=1 Tax=Facklamia sp. 7083-14-GEN3 TaxID=2973478 RepID=UPI00215C0CF1|nr:GNAT family N-acetyltransferase [Facklamia sp. 7083-14-GEN3]MCR8968450.1 GNAT family N-acetyltransferase [Facklamia sp. 7083-14-GEN3]
MFYDTSLLKDQTIYLKLKKTSEAQAEKNWVPAYYFDICLLNGTKIGYCDLRIGHNKNTYIGGNIGYGIDADYRGNHYAAKACRLLFKLAKQHNMSYLIITTDPANIASYRTCERLGGELIEIADIPKNHDMYQRGMRKVNIYQFDFS